MIAASVTTTGAISRYGADQRTALARVNGRRRRGWRAASAAYAVPPGISLKRLPGSSGRYWLSVSSMLLSAKAVAWAMLAFPVRIRASIVRRTLPFSTLTQFFAVGTNQLFLAGRSLTLLPSRLVALGMFPFACRPFSPAVLVKIRIQSAASDLSFEPAGTARSEPPRKPGMPWPFTWLRITNCLVAFVYFLPTQQLNQAGPTIDAALPCE